MIENQINVLREENSEKTGPSISVGTLLEWGYVSSRPTHLVLVLADNGWGVPAGHVEKGERFIEATLREVYEETKIPDNHIVFLDRYGHRTEIASPMYFGDFFKNNRLRIGAIFRAKIVGVKFQKEGWEIKGDPKIKMAKAFNTKELLNLLQGTLDQSESKKSLRIPEFNFEAILKWILEGGPSYPPIKRIADFLEINLGKIQGLHKLPPDSFDKHSPQVKFLYTPPNTSKRHNPEVQDWLGWRKKFETIADIVGN